MSIRAIASAIGDVTGDWASWEPEDGTDLFAYFDALPDMLHDVAYAVAANARRLETTGLRESLVDKLHDIATELAAAEDHAAEMEWVAHI